MRKDKRRNLTYKHITTHTETELDVKSYIGHEEYNDKSTFEKIKSIVFSVNRAPECKDFTLVYINKNLHITLTIKNKSN